MSVAIPLFPLYARVIGASSPEVGEPLRRPQRGQTDPDGHLWDINYDPAMPVRDDRVKPAAKAGRRTRVRARR